MLPFNVPRAYPPGWADLLRNTVLRPDRRWSPAESVSILLATRELQAWLADSRAYAGRDHKWSWLSVLSDFLRSADQAGPALTASLGPDLPAAVATAKNLKTDLESKSHRDMEAAFPASRSAASPVIGRLSSRWGKPDVRLAAWHDLIEACRDTAVPHDALAARRDLFWEMTRAGDLSTRQLSGSLAGTLADSAYSVDLAKVWLGDIADTGTSRRRLDEAAGLTENEQLDLCGRLVTQPAVPGRYVVWRAYYHADPGTTYRRLGPVQFWNAKWLRAVLAHGQGPNWEAIPGELKAADGLFGPDDLPEDAQDVLLARADLGSGAWTDPVRAATEQIESVVTLASFRVGDAKWRLMDGYLAAIDGRVRGIGSFHRAVSRDEFPNHLYQAAMDAELDALARQLASRLPVADKALSETIRAVHWWQQARKQSPLAAVLLHVRVVELLAHQTGVGKWYAYLDEYQRASWIRHHLIYELGRVIDDCMNNADRLPDPADQQWLHDLRRATTTYQPGGAFRRDLGKGLDELPTLSRLFPPGDSLGRRVQDAVSRYTLHGLPAWREDLTRDWQLALERAVRVRNTLAHGGPLMDDTVATVHEFIERLAQWSLQVALEGLLGGQDVATANGEHKRKGDQWNDKLASAATVTDALTG